MNRGFEFRLERLLETRRASEKSARRDLAEARRAVARREERVGSLSRDRSHAEEDRKAMLAGRVDAGRLALAAAFESALERSLGAERRGLRSEAEAAERKLAALVAAAQRVRVLERLEERRRAAWTEARRLEEQKESDERGRGKCVL